MYHLAALGARILIMNSKLLEDYLGAFKGAEASMPFGPEALVYKVMGKMFALVSQKEETPRVTLKCKPADGEVLTAQYESIQPGYYMNKRHWITITLNDEISKEMVEDLARDSYALVVSKLTKRDKVTLAEQG